MNRRRIRERWFNEAATIAHGIPVDVHVASDISGRARRLPPPVREALMGASREALRNVARHSGSRNARILLRVTPDLVEVEVSDKGRGRVTGQPDGFGIRNSMKARMREVGGTAEVESGPGVGGTVARLRWHPPLRTASQQMASTYRKTVAASGGPVAFLRFGLPLLVCHTLIGLVTLGQQPRPVATLVMICALLAMSSTVLLQLHAGPPTPISVLAWSFAFSGAIAVDLVVSGPGSTTGYTSFAIGLGTVPLALFAYVVPLPQIVLLTGLPMVSVLARVLIDPGANLGNSIGAINAAFMTTTVAALVGLLIRRTAGSTALERDRLVTADEESSRRQFQRSAQDDHLRHTRQEIVPFLAAIADGSRSPTPGSTRDLATLLAAEARDDMYASGFFDDDLRAAVTGFRRAGGEVVIRPGFAPGGFERTSGRLLLYLVTALGGHHRITLSVDIERNWVRLVVVPGLATGEVADVSGVVSDEALLVETDEFATIVSFPERGASPNMTIPAGGGLDVGLEP